jgi:hypothetical protein
LKGGHKRYRCYLGGFPERARILIGAGLDEPVLHVCGGLARHYPYSRGFGPYDCTLDLDPATEPDYLADARKPLPDPTRWRAILIDPPYSKEDAAHYPGAGADAYPEPGLLVCNAIDALVTGRRAGLIHYVLPKCPPNARFVACVGVCCGFNNRIRCFSVFTDVSLKERPGL